MDRPTTASLIQALKAAGSAHHDYESNALNGQHDEQWPGWYAAYVLGRLGDFVTPTVLAQWLEEAPGSDNWAETAAGYIEIKLG